MNYQIATVYFKVWLSLAQFEASIGEPDSVDRAREVFERAYKTLRTANDKEERLMLVEHWRDFEVMKTDLILLDNEKILFCL